MGYMNITKSAFMEMVRCRRYPSLHKLFKRRNFDDETIERIWDLVEHSGINIEDITKQDLKQLEIMMPYFDKIEILAARYVLSKWGGKARYGIKKGMQKQFTREYDSFVLMCNVDVFHKNQDTTNIIEVKATTTNKFLKMGYKVRRVHHPIFYVGDDDILHLMEEKNPNLLKDAKYIKQRNKLFDRFSDVGVYVYDLAFQRFIVEEKIKGANYYLGILNHEYVFDGTYVDGEAVYDNNIIRLVDLTSITNEIQSVIKKEVSLVVERIIKDNDAPTKLGKHCQLKKQRECLFTDICYQDFPKKNSILHYLSRHNGFKDEHGEKHELFDLIEEGYRHMLDIPHSWLHRKNNQIQRDVALTHKPYIDKQKIKDGMSVIKYPIYHLDFESFPCPLPRFKGEKPYMQSLFQFSLHIEREPGICDKENDHIEFLAKDHVDRRMELVEALIKAIPMDGGSIMVYNQTFEKTRLKELAQFFPKYEENFYDMINRLFDLQDLVKTRKSLYENLGYDEERAKVINYYHEDLLGSYSIKKVLPIFSNLSYKDMEVGNGMEAVHAYASYPNLSKSELEYTQKALIEYCKQDTWAMVEILDRLRKLI